MTNESGPDPMNQAQEKQGFFRRHRRLFLVLGGCAAAFVLTVAAASAFVLYKASRVFPRTIPEIIPADALAYVEVLNLDERFPDIESFVAGIRSSPAYRQVAASHRAWRESGMDRGIDGALSALRNVRDRFGFDALSCVAGSESALAVFNHPPAAPGGKPGMSFIAATRISGLYVRVPALFPSALASSAADGKNLVFDSSGKYPSLSFKAGAAETEAGVADAESGQKRVWFAVLKDLLLVASDEGTLARTIAVANSEIPDSLATNPGFSAAFEALEPSPGALGRFYADFDAFDSIASVRKSSRFTVAKFPMNLIAPYANQIQDGVLDINAARHVAGSFGIDGNENMVADFAIHYGGRAVGLGTAAAAAAASDRSLDLAPAPDSSALVFGFNRSAREFWDAVRRDADEQDGARLDAVAAKHGDRLDRLLGALGAEFTIVIQAHPAAAGGGSRFPLPWLCISGKTSDPQACALALRSIFEEEISKIAEKLEIKPYVFDEKYSEADLCSIGGLPEGATAEISPDFSPGFATWRDRIFVFTSKPFAFRVIDAFASEKIASGAAQSGRAAGLGLPKASFTMLLDMKALADGVSMQGYREGIAELILPLDWHAINAKITSGRGQLQDAEFTREQMMAKARIEAERMRVAASIHQNAQVIRVLDSIRLDCAHAGAFSGQPAAMRGRLVVTFATGR